ncbi:MAG: hypothetical protein JST82_01410 [Bacteroidetes bacterium]|nr:hypothetical protein [Bacteroidota bacterium]
MHSDDNTPEFAFFKAITTKDKSYFCDFHKATTPEGSIQYTVSLQSLNNENLVSVLQHTPDAGWRVITNRDAIHPDLEWALITAIISYEKG